jgi:hypothetical protein
MKRLLLLELFFCLSIGLLQSQILPIHVKPVGSKNWKFANMNGEVIVNSDYAVSYPFSEDGIAVVGYPRKDVYILLNRNGEEIQNQLKGYFLKDIMGFVNSACFSSGLLVVRMKEKWGCVDTSGNLAIPMKYEELSLFSNGYGVGRIGKNFFIVKSNGNETLIKEKNIYNIKQFKENLAPYIALDKLIGFIDTTGKSVIPARFLSVGYFCNGLAWAANSDGKIGFINNSGEWVVQPLFSGAKDFDKKSGLARVKKDEKWVYVNEKGEIISFNISEITDDFNEGLSRGKTGYSFGFYNNKGEWIIQPQFEGTRNFKNGYAAAKANGLWGIIDKTGNWVIKPSFIGIKDVEIFKKGNSY